MLVRQILPLFYGGVYFDVDLALWRSVDAEVALMV